MLDSNRADDVLLLTIHLDKGPIRRPKHSGILGGGVRAQGFKVRGSGFGGRAVLRSIPPIPGNHPAMNPKP